MWEDFQCLVQFLIAFLVFAGWTYKLRGVCYNDEGWHGLEKSIKAIFTGAVQESKFEIDERWIIAGEYGQLGPKNTGSNYSAKERIFAGS